MRVLHLTSQPPDFQAEYCAQRIVQELGGEFEIVGRRLGEQGTGRNPLSSIWWLRRAAHDFDVIHAWDFASARLAAAATRGVIFSPSEGLKASELRWLKWMARYRAMQIVSAAPSHREQILRAGIAASQIDVASLPLPIVAAAARDGQLREVLGIAPDDRVLLAPGESTRGAGHRYALWAASILHVLDPRWRLLVWGRGPLVQSLEEMARKFERPRVLCIAERKLGRAMKFEELLPAADLTLVTPHGLASPLPIHICMAAGLPMVASTSPFTSDFLNQKYAAMVPGLSPRLLAQRALALFEDEPMRNRLGQGAQCSITSKDNQFAERHVSVYRKTAGTLI